MIAKIWYFYKNEKIANSIQDLTNGPFDLLTLSPLGDYIATFTQDKCIWVVKSDFSQNLSQFDTKASDKPDQMVWCGGDCVVLYWGPETLNRGGISLLLMIGRVTSYKC